MNDLDAQVGKHVTQQAYGLLKAEAVYLIGLL
jgi:hypothetical protein